MGIRRADIRVHSAQADFRNRLGDPGTGQGPRRADGHRQRICRHIHTVLNGDDGVIRRILDHVEGHVAEVPLVGDAVAATQNRFPVAEDVVSEPNFRAEIIPLLLPESTLGAIRRDRNARVTDLLKDVCTRTEVQVGVQIGILVVLNSKVFPAQAEIECQAIRQFPLIRPVEREFVITVAPRERRLVYRRHHVALDIRIAGSVSAVRTLRPVRIIRIFRKQRERAREVALRINGSLKLRQLAI